MTSSAAALQSVLELGAYGTQASTSGVVTFTRTQRVLDPSLYDGVANCWYEIVAYSNDTAAQTATLWDVTAGAALATITIPAGQTTYTRQRSSTFALPASAHTVEVRLSQCTSGKLVYVRSNHVLVDQSGATKTAFDTPSLLYAAQGTSATDQTVSADPTAAASYGQPTIGLYDRWLYDSSQYGTVTALTFMALLNSSNASGIAYVELYDITLGQAVAGTALSVTGTAAALATVDVTSLLASGHEYTVYVKSNSGSYTAYVHMAWVRITLSPLIKCETRIRTLLPIASGTAATGYNYCEYYWEAAKWGGAQSVYFEAVGFGGDSGSATSQALLYASNDGSSGLVLASTQGGSNYQGGSGNFAGAGVAARIRTNAITPTDGWRLFGERVAQTAAETVCGNFLIVQQTFIISGTGAGALQGAGAESGAEAITKVVSGAGAGAVQVAGAESGAEAITKVVSGAGAGAVQVAGAESGAEAITKVVSGAGAGAVEIAGAETGATLFIPVDTEPLAIAVAAPQPQAAADAPFVWFTDTAVDIMVAGPPAPDVSGAVATSPTIVPPAPPGFSTDVDIILYDPTGHVLRHLHDEFQALKTSRARQYGFETASWDMPACLVTLWYQELAPFNGVKVVRRGITCFEGRITDPGVSIGDSDFCRKVTAFGHFLGFSDDETVRGLVADSDFGSWRSRLKTIAHDFGISVDSGLGTTPGEIVAQAKWGSSYAASPGFGGVLDTDNAFAEVAWQLYKGTPTNDKASGISVAFKWNGKLDPANIVTNKVPQYNLFPDPRAMAGGSDSSTWQLEPADAPTIGAGASPIRGPLTSPEPGRPANYFQWDWDHAFNGMDPGTASWDCSMAIPSDLQAQINAEDGVTVYFGLWSATNRLFTSDAIIMLARDQAGNVLAESIIGLSASRAWAWAESSIVVPPGATELLMVANLELDGDFDGWHRICLPVVTNEVPADTYVDGFASGWEWTGKANESQSRQTDETVTKGVLEWVEEVTGGIALIATLYGSDSPDDPAAPYEIIRQWNSKDKQSGMASGGGGWSGYGIAIGFQGCPYTLQFKAPSTGGASEPYGLVISDYEVTGYIPSGVVVAVEAVAGWAGASALDFPDSSGVSIGQMTFDTATTWAAMLQALDALLGWEYGFRENATFYYYDPDRLARDPSSVYVLPYDQTQADLTNQTDDCCNGCEVTWTMADGSSIGRVQATGGSGVIPPQVRRIHHVDGPAGIAPGDAYTLARAYNADHAAPDPSGSLLLTVESVVDLAGNTHDVLSIMEGQYVKLTGAPDDDDFGLLQIQRVTIDHDTLTATLDIGLNRKKLDCQLARLDARVVRR